MKKYLLYLTYCANVYHLFSIEPEDFELKEESQLLKIIATNSPHYRVGEYSWATIEGENREIMEFNSDEDAILWFELEYGRRHK